METGQGDELPAVSETSQVVVEGRELYVRHARRVPVEGGGEVVGEHLMGELGLFTEERAGEGREGQKRSGFFFSRAPLVY